MFVNGKFIRVIGEVKTYGEKGFRKRELVLTTEEQYPQHILIEFVQNNCDLLDNFQIGETVRIGINIRGREWVNPEGETKFFNSIQGWRIESIDEQVSDDLPEDLPAIDSKDESQDYIKSLMFRVNIISYTLLTILNILLV